MGETQEKDKQVFNEASPSDPNVVAPVETVTEAPSPNPLAANEAHGTSPPTATQGSFPPSSILNEILIKYSDFMNSYLDTCVMNLNFWMRVRAPPNASRDVNNLRVSPCWCAEEFLLLIFL